MSSYDFTKLEELSNIPGEDIDIKLYEPDDFIRRTQYPHVTTVRKDVMTYTNPDSPENPIVRTIITKKLKGSRGVLDRYLNWKPFGAALHNNKSYTTISDPVFIEPYNKLEDTSTHSLKAVSTGVAYKPKINIIENSKKKTSGLYKPSINNIKAATVNTNSSLIIKNFPTDLLKDDIEDRLYTLFSKYGAIKRINVLINKITGDVKDIAFIDFYNPTDSNTVLESNERFILDNLILTIEKNNKKEE
jgi:RNA recognition motif-containing protein